MKLENIGATHDCDESVRHDVLEVSDVREMLHATRIQMSGTHTNERHLIVSFCCILISHEPPLHLMLSSCDMPVNFPAVRIGI